MIKTAFAAFKLAGLTTHLVTAAIVIAALIAGYAVWHHHVWSNGYDDALKDIAKQDTKAIARANTYRGVARACSARGLRWQQSTGKCVGG